MPVETYLSLKQLLTRIQNQIRGSFPSSYWIRAEVAGIRKIGSHVYFDLIELERGAKVAQIRAVAFFGEGTNAIAGFEKITGQKFSEGIKIGVRVTVNFHPVYGLSLVLCEIDAELTLGGIELQRKQTLAKLLADHPRIIQLREGNYITPNKLLPLPKVIQRIALITSSSSDAYNDFMHSLDSNEYGYKFNVDPFNVLVQGYGAQSSLFNALSKVRVSGKVYDAVVVTRGGGAPADFLPFDDYHLALQVAQFSIPVITGIGHHMNQGICDFFAKVHTKTPSIAAQFILDHNHNFDKQLIRFSSAIRSLGTQTLSGEVNRFQGLKSGFGTLVKEAVRDNYARIATIKGDLSARTNRLIVHSAHNLTNKKLYLNGKAKAILYGYEKDLAEKSLTFTFMPKQILRAENQKTFTLQDQIINRLPQVLSGQKRELNRLKEHVQNLSPEKILKRGFAIIRKNGKIISDSAGIQAGDSLQIIHDRSLIDTEVKNKTNYNGREFDV